MAPTRVQNTKLIIGVDFYVRGGGGGHEKAQLAVHAFSQHGARRTHSTSTAGAHGTHKATPHPRAHDAVCLSVTRATRRRLMHNCRRSSSMTHDHGEVVGTQKRRWSTCLAPAPGGGPLPAALPCPAPRRGTRSLTAAGRRLAWQCEAAAAARPGSKCVLTSSVGCTQPVSACVDKGIASRPCWPVAAAAAAAVASQNGRHPSLSQRVRGAHVYTRVWCGGSPRPLMQGKAPGRFYNQPSSRAQRRAMSGG